jgi:DNA adenine methylase Dam
MTGQSFDSDLAMLHQRCVKNGMSSPVGFAKNGQPYLKARKHIDLCEVFRKPMVMSTIFKGRYRTLRLEEVAQAILGKGKFGNNALGGSRITGANVGSMPIDTQKSYVLQDAQLVMDLLKVNNGQVIALMQAIAELTGLSLERVCHTSISKWWTKVFDDMGCVPVPTQLDSERSDARDAAATSSFDYEGGLVMEPKPGVYYNVKNVDAESLYPSLIIFYNLSPDTINCSCCANREDARVPAEVIPGRSYWICKQREGAFPKKEREFKAERIRQKHLGNEAKQLGLKILINGGYGLFGNPYFKYADVRVAELITAYGRYTLREMQKIASKHGLTAIAGDTDSLFLEGGSDDSAVSSMIAECKEKLGVNVESKETYEKFVNIKKKHYFGVVAGTGEIRVAGMEGKKNDRPAWINEVFDQFLEDFKTDRDPIVNLKAAINDLENGKIDPELLKIKVKLAKDPVDYAVNNPNKKIGMLLGAKAGDIIWYYKTDGKKGGVTINPEEIGISRYKEMLLATVKDAFEILSIQQRGMQSETTRSSQSTFDLHTQIPQCHPFVKWAGGKTQLLPELEKYIPDNNFTRYFEPFLGGCALFFYLVSSKQLKFTAYLSDVNKELINAYKVIKDDVEALIELLRIHEKGYKANPDEYYYKLRAEPKPLTDVESAARFITLNKTCYNGLYRVNKNGMFNVPIGRYKNPLICDSKNLRNVSMALRHTNAHLFVSNYQETLELAGDKGDFIYLDPPYKPTSTTASFTGYTKEGFGEKDQIALCEVFKKLDRKGCKIMLSNSDTPFIRELYSEFKEYTNQVSVLRAINSKATKRTGHTELLIRNYKISTG